MLAPPLASHHARNPDICLLSFLLVSVCAALLTSNLFELWEPGNVSEAWTEFVETELFSAKKGLYLILMLQAVLVALRGSFTSRRKCRFRFTSSTHY